MQKRTNKKTIGMIPYSLALRVANPSESDVEKKIYPIAQRYETVNLGQLANHIHEHNSQFSQGTIIGILTDMVDCIKEQLMSGNFVLLDGLCRIFYTLKATGVAKAEDFDSSMIQRVNLRADVDNVFEEELNYSSKFTYVASRKEQALAKQKEKAALTAGATPDDNENENENGNGNDNGNDNPGGEITE